MIKLINSIAWRRLDNCPLSSFELC